MAWVHLDCLGRLLNVFGEPLDQGEPLPTDNYRNIRGNLSHLVTLCLLVVY